MPLTSGRRKNKRKKDLGAGKYRCMVRKNILI
jgi:hypothetical protein